MLIVRLEAGCLTVKGGGKPKTWSKAKRAQRDTDGRWTLKRGRKRSAHRSGWQEHSRTELVIAVFGYKNPLGIDRRHGFIRTFAVTTAATRDGRQLGKLLDRHNTASPVWADRAIARRPTLLCWHDAGWCRISSGPNRPAGRCRRIWCAAMPAGRG